MAKRKVKPPITQARYIPPDPRDAFPKFTKVRNFRKGKAYEHKVIRELKSKFPGLFRTGVNICWSCATHKNKTCKPDGIIRSENKIIALEIKTTLYGDGCRFKRYTELEDLYVPILKYLHPDKEVYGVYIANKVAGKIPHPRIALSHILQVEDPLSYLYLDTFTT